MIYIKKFNNVAEANAAGAIGLESPHIDLVDDKNTVNIYAPGETFTCEFDANGSIVIPQPTGTTNWCIARNCRIEISEGLFYGMDLGSSLVWGADIFAMEDPNYTTEIDLTNNKVRYTISGEPSYEFDIRYVTPDEKYMIAIYFGDNLKVILVDCSNPNKIENYQINAFGNPILPDFNKMGQYDIQPIPEYFEEGVFEKLVNQMITKVGDDPSLASNFRLTHPTLEEYTPIIDTYETQFKERGGTDEEWAFLRESNLEITQENKWPFFKIYVGTIIYSYNGEDRIIAIFGV